MNNLKNNPVEKIVLWGPTPYWIFWKIWANDLKKTQLAGKEKGVKIDKKSFFGLEPIEHLIRSTVIQTTVAIGDTDKDCTPEYINYLKALTVNNKFVKIEEPIKNASHVITSESGSEVIDSYLNILLGG